ncbi:geranylgeranyl pyrophosphate synthase [Streptomyces phaeochromogenes]|uniref:hypothetical protein n=1 Tax=Streptomyces phaeochromogenes TaxID=1923 RepID=UPI0027919098|nr:hypothetical protein [Streptomyces phaeochromogenes]MDQ0955802.1 geranylgeranyl pyrophosphate synthase [Streptomyces phaeochromogenes]
MTSTRPCPRGCHILGRRRCRAALAARRAEAEAISRACAAPAAGLGMFHQYGLIHDDIIGASLTRRGSAEQLRITGPVLAR